MTKKLNRRAIFAASVVLLFAMPADDSPVWLTQILITKTMAFAGFTAIFKPQILTKTRNFMEKAIKGNKALAAYLGVSISTIQSWRAKGILNKAVKLHVGRTIIYDPAKLDIKYK